MKPAGLLGALALTTLSVTVASAQATGGLRVRVVENSDKSAVSGAAVTLSNTNKLVATSSIVTDADGVALFPVLRAGSGYILTVVMDGYAGIRQDAVVVNGTIEDVVIALAPEHVENIVVTDKGRRVDLDSNETSTRFSSDFIADLPVAGRFYQHVLSLAPGVQDPDGDGNPNVNGARERDFKTQVGGISNVDPLTGTFLNLVTIDSIEDLTVITAGAGAEFGRAQGGFAQIIQKQGSNDFEGVFGMLYSSRLLDGNGATNIPDSLFPDFYLYQPSLQVSGPIVKDRLWYRLSQEMIRREDPLVFAAGGNVSTVGTRRFSTDDQLTWQVSNRNKLAFSFRSDPLTQTNVGISAVLPSSSSERVETGGPTYTLAWTAPYSPSLLVDSTIAYQDSQLAFTPMASGVPNGCAPGSSPLSRYQCFDVAGGNVSGSSPRDWHDSRQRLTVKSDATYYKGRLWGANHQFKVGLILENERYFRSLERRPSLLTSPGLLDAPTGRPTTNYTITASLKPFSQQRASGNTWGIYGEDVLRPVPNLSITLGLRVEDESITANGYRPLDPEGDSNALLARTPGWSARLRRAEMYETFVAYEDRLGAAAAVEAQLGIATADSGFYAQQSLWQRYRQPANINIDNVNLSPRFAVGWDPWSDGKTKFSISAGRYYDKIFLGVLTTESEPVLANFQMQVVDDRFPSRITFSPSFGYSIVDRDLKTPHDDEYSFKVERRFLQENTISLTYIRRSFKDQLQDVNVNQTPGDWGRCFKTLSADDEPMVPSPGTGPVTDPYTLQVYQDTDPGIGDGRLDDCVGKIERIVPVDGDGEGTGAPIDVQRPDSIADYYVLNPAWGNIFKIGNVNRARYDGFTIEYVRRQYKNWQMEASYTWSKATGDAEDFNLALGDDRSTLQDEPGYLSYDRRHSLKVNATCLTPWGFRLGGSAQWESGLPYSLLYRDASQSVPLPPYGEFSTPFTSVRTRYVTHQRNDQRNPSAWNFDAKIAKEMNLPKGMNLQLDAEIFNLLNEDTYSVYNNFTKRGQQVNGTNDATRRFGRTYQVGMRLAF